MSNRFAYDEHIEEQPTAIADVLARLEPPSLDPDRPLIFSGIGTSLHACRVAATWVAELSGGAIRPSAIRADDLATGAVIHPNDQVVVVSHRGMKRFPAKVLARAHQLGATTVLVTGHGAPDTLLADHVLRTCPAERASTHTVSYTSALAALGLLVTRLLGDPAQDFAAALAGVPAALERTLALPPPVGPAERLADREPVLFAGWGLDAITADEAALKVTEGTYVWSVGMAVEAALHGPPAVFDGRMAAVLLTPGATGAANRSRVAELHAMLTELGAAVIAWGDEGEELGFAPVHPLTRPLVSILPIQRLVAEMARGRGTDPDTIRADVEPWASAIARVQL